MMNNSYDNKLNTIKWIGIVTMTLDHIGFFLLPNQLFLRIIGRIAFPCFLYSTIEGTKRTSNYRRYIARLIFLGIISMPVTPNTVNVLFLLALFSLSIKYKRFAFVFGAASIFTEYSIYGFLFGWSIYWLKEKNWVQGTVFASLIQILAGYSVQAFSLVSLPLFIMPNRLKFPALPRYLFYAYYPLHQLLLLGLALSMNY